jgi:hypothetical protein
VGDVEDVRSVFGQHDRELGREGALGGRDGDGVVADVVLFELRQVSTPPLATEDRDVVTALDEGFGVAPEPMIGGRPSVLGGPERDDADVHIEEGRGRR